MNLPYQTDRALVLRLIGDVEQEKWFSNPFRYLIQNWEKRGEALVNAACETIGAIATRHSVDDLRIAYDVVMDMRIASGVGHGERPTADDGMWEIIDTVLTLLTIGLGERFIKELFYKQLNYAQELHGFSPEKKRMALAATVCSIADIAEAEYREHDRKIEELINAEVKDHEAAHS